MIGIAFFFLVILPFITSDVVDSFVVTLGERTSDQGRMVQETYDGDIIVFGYTTGFGTGDSSYLAARFDVSGRLIWASVTGTFGTDYCYFGMQTSDKGYVMVGISNTEGAGDYDTFVVKLYENGLLEWAKLFGGSSSDYSYSVDEVSTGGFILGGETYSWTYTFLDGPSTRDSFLIRLDENGGLIWAKSYGSSSNQEISYGEVKEVSDGGFIFVGMTYSWGPGSWSNWLMKLDEDGFEAWTTVFGSGSQDSVYSVVETSDNGFYVCGHFEGLGTGSSALYVAKFTSSGSISWSSTVGGSGGEYGERVIISPDGGPIVAARATSTGYGSYDFVLVKWDSSGNYEWASVFADGVLYERPYGIALTSDEQKYIITGFSDSFGAGSYDIALLYLNVDGTGCGWENYDGFTVNKDLNLSPTGQNPSRVDITGMGDETLVQGSNVFQTFPGSLTPEVFCMDTDLVTNFVMTFGDTGTEMVMGIDETDSGVVVFGHTDSVGAGGTDFMVALFDDIGQLTWCSVVGTLLDDYALDGLSTSDGGFIVVGYSDGAGSAGSDDVMVAKLDSDGNLDWVKMYGGTGSDQGKGIIEVSNGYVISGSTYSWGPGASSSLLIKIGLDGTLIWANSYGYDPGEEDGLGIVETSDSGIAVASYTSAYTSQSAMVIKFDSDGNFEWNTVLEGSNEDYFLDIVETSDGEHLVASGYTNSFGPGTGSEWSLLVAKFSLDTGTLEWNNVVGGSVDDIGNALVATPDDEGVVVVGESSSFGSGSNDLLMMKFDTYGDLEWSGVYGFISDDRLYSVAVNREGSKFFVGGFTDSIGAGNEDMFVLDVPINGDGCGWESVGGFVEEKDAAFTVHNPDDLTENDISASITESTIPIGVDVFLEDSAGISPDFYAKDVCSEWSCNDLSKDYTSMVCGGGKGTCDAFDTCDCESGYSGEFCEDFYCGDYFRNDEDVCNKHGNCTESYKCICDDGYTGNLCDEWECGLYPNTDPSGCQGNGWCVSSQLCDCNPGYTGDLCTDWSCYNISNDNETHVCSSKGSCEGYNDCKCEVGYFGDNCEDYYCGNFLYYNTTYVCSKHGTCESSHYCDCETGYFGDLCDEWFCGSSSHTDSTGCNNHGTCIASHTCDCYDGYIDQFCDMWSCEGILKNLTEDVCSGFGECSDYETCSCDFGHDGVYCEIFFCDNMRPNDTGVCGGFGNCTSHDQCSCKNGYDGNLCQDFKCQNYDHTEPEGCNNNGFCVADDTCICLDGYTNQFCDMWTCGDIFKNMTDEVCSGHGTCEALESCVCDSGYSGDLCTEFYCGPYFKNDTEVCNEAGNCTESHMCSCLSSYSGDLCEDYECNEFSHDHSLVCHERGICVAPELCLCDEGYNGTYCDEWECFGIDKDNETHVCSGRGSCEGYDDCECEVGYFGESCDEYYCGRFLHDNFTYVCSKHGTCESSHYCACENEYYGEYCETWNCGSYPYTDSTGCSNHGSCVAVHTCDCNDGYIEQFCDVWSCNDILKNYTDDVCSGHGSCVDYEECDCEFGYEGIDCETFYCDKKLPNETDVCNGKGNCTDYDFCSCQSGYTGDLCTEFYCGPVLNTDSLTSGCGGHGVCAESQKCDCDDGYDGDLCTEWTCGGVDEGDHDVCSDHGSCEFLDSCSCSPGYSGDLCDQWICPDGDNGTRMDDPHVCSGNGNCTAFWDCDCEDGWVGDYCNTFIGYWTCYGIDASLTTEVCGGHGTCKFQDECICEYGYYFNETSDFFGEGTDPCSVWFCGNFSNGEFDTNYTDPASGEIKYRCHGRGECDQPEECTCLEGYRGDLCEEVICGDIPHTSSSVCSGRGECVNPEECVCNVMEEDEGYIFSYFGKDCEVIVGRYLVKTTPVILTVYFEIDEEKLKENYGLEVEEEFECSRFFSGGDEEVAELFSGVCSLTAYNEFTYHVGLTKFMKIDVSGVSEDTLNALLERQGDEGTIDVFVYGELFPVYMKPVLSVIESEVATQKTMQFFEEESLTDDELGAAPDTELCKEKLKIGGDQCIDVYECVEDPASKKYISVGYTPHTIREGYYYTKFYYDNLEDCKEGKKFSEFKQFSSVSCYGSDYGDNFIMYDGCSDDYASMIFETNVIAYFGASLVPIVLIVLPALICLCCICCINFLIIHATTNTGYGRKITEKIFKRSKEYDEVDQDTDDVIAKVEEMNNEREEELEEGGKESEGDTWDSDGSIFGSTAEEEKEEEEEPFGTKTVLFKKKTEEEEEDIGEVKLPLQMMTKMTKKQIMEGEEDVVIEQKVDDYADEKSQSSEESESRESEEKEGRLKKLLCCFKCFWKWLCQPLFGVTLSMSLLITILVREAIYLYFSTSEFLSTSDIDRANQNYILLTTVLRTTSIITWVTIGVYLALLIIFIFIYVNRFFYDPFMFCISFGSLKEYIVFRVFKASFMSWFICFNLFCYIVKFGYGSKDERDKQISLYTFWLRIILPETLLVINLITVLSYNGVSSHTHLKKLRDLGWKGMINEFPRVNLPIWKLLSSGVDEILEDFFQLIFLIDPEPGEKLSDYISKLKYSADYGHLSWSFIMFMDEDDIIYLRDFFFPPSERREVKKESYFTVFQHHKITSVKWCGALCLVPCSLCTLVFRKLFPKKKVEEEKGEEDEDLASVDQVQKEE